MQGVREREETVTEKECRTERAKRHRAERGRDTTKRDRKENHYEYATYTFAFHAKCETCTIPLKQKVYLQCMYV